MTLDRKGIERTRNRSGARRKFVSAAVEEARRLAARCATDAERAQVLLALLAATEGTE